MIFQKKSDKEETVPILPIGKEQVREAYQTLLQYKRGKANLEQRVIRNEQWYRLRQWESFRRKESGVEPASAWLFHSLQSKHADCMDNYPTPCFLPREEGDAREADALSKIVPVILERNDFEQVYSDETDDKLHSGTGIYGVFWDKNALGGLGDISVRSVDILSIFWEPGKQELQDSRNVFTVELCDNDLLLAQYPFPEDKLGGTKGELSQYIHDDSVDTSGKSAVIDWYYKKKQNGKTVLHYVKFVGETVLFATENEEAYRERGWYDHGKYPFVFDRLFRIKGSPCGFGYLDIGKSVQEYIDRGDQAIMENLLANASPRHMLSKASSVNEEEFLDVSKPIIHVEGLLSEEQIRPMTVNPLSGIYQSIMQEKINELKEVTGNRDVSNGGASGGVTAASAIAAMQEAGSKLSRDFNKGSYRAFRNVVLLVVELIRQFYDLPRQFRITGTGGVTQFVSYDNGGIRAQTQVGASGEDMGCRLPLFDIEITALKASPYSKLSQNELALQFYSQGLFEPQRAQQAAAALQMMDFDCKESVLRTVIRNGMLWQKTQAEQAERFTRSEEAPAPKQSSFRASRSDALGGGTAAGETAMTRQARQRAAEAAKP